MRLQSMIAALVITLCASGVKAGCDDTYASCKSSCTGPFSGSATFDTLFGGSGVGTVIGNRIPQDCANECDYQRSACLQATRPVDPDEQARRAEAERKQVEAVKKEMEAQRIEDARIQHQQAADKRAARPPKDRAALIAASHQCALNNYWTRKEYPGKQLPCDKIPSVFDVDPQHMPRLPAAGYVDEHPDEPCRTGSCFLYRAVRDECLPNHLDSYGVCRDADGHYVTVEARKSRR